MAVSYDASMSNHLPVAEGWLLCSFQIVSKVRKFVIGLMGSYSIGWPTILMRWGRDRAGEANRIVRTRGWRTKFFPHSQAAALTVNRFG